MSEVIKGHCLCGAVTFTAVAKSHDVTVCHCSMCNRWSGGLLLFLDIEGSPVFAGAESIAIYRSSATGERGFCKICGSSLFWRVVGEDRYTLSAGALDDNAALRLATEIYFEDKPSYYEFANPTAKQTGEEAMPYYLTKDN